MDKIHQDNERTQIENYMKLYCLEELLDETVNTILEKRPDNPYVELARLIESKSMAEILDVNIASSFGEKGRCSVTCMVTTNAGRFVGTFGMPLTKAREDGSILQDFSIMNGKINDQLKGLDPRNLREVDDKLSGIANLPASLHLATSIACCRAGAKHKGVELYQFLAEYSETDALRLPMPMASTAVRSAAGKVNDQDQPLLQEIWLTATNSLTFEQAMESLLLAHECVKKHVVQSKCPLSFPEHGATHVVQNSLEETISVRVLFSCDIFCCELFAGCDDGARQLRTAHACSTECIRAGTLLRLHPRTPGRGGRGSGSCRYESQRHALLVHCPR